MTPENRPLEVLVVSHRVSLLHEISWTLEAIGVFVQTSDNFDQDALWRRYSDPDFVIVDSQGCQEPTGGTFAHNSDNPIYRMFLYDPSTKTDFAAWYSAGAHDALRIPLSRGELLARIRAGARYLEFERRLQKQSSRSVVPSMYSRRGFLRKLEKMAAGDVKNESNHTILVTSIDWYAGIRQVGGETASGSIVNTAARAIKRVAGENAVSAYLGNGRFATLLVGQSLSSAKNVADALARDFGSRESHHESIPRPAITSAVAPWMASSDSARSLNDALETLKLAEHSGGGRVLQHGEYSKELAAWNDEISTGNPFANVVAQDIMEPFPACLAEGSDQSELADALFQSDAVVRPYVDGEGRLIGAALLEQSASDTFSGKASETFTASPSMPETIAYDATFPDIFEAFSSRGCDVLTVTADGRPLGYVTRDGFLSMIDPLDSGTFASTCEPTNELPYLAVPSLKFGDDHDSVAL